MQKQIVEMFLYRAISFDPKRLGDVYAQLELGAISATEFANWVASEHLMLREKALREMAKKLGVSIDIEGN